MTTDGLITPKDAIVTACNELVRDLATLSREFTKEFELRKMVGTGAGGPAEDGQQGDAGAGGV